MKRITVVGAGALGSHVVQFLRNVDATIRVVDYDRVEQKNVMSQFHGKPHVGKLKVDALKQSALMFWGTKIETFSSKLGDGNVKELLGGSDLVLDLVDNGATRRVIQRFVRDAVMASTIPCLHGALDANGSFGRVAWDESFVVDDEGAGGAATCEDGEHLPFIAVTASYIAKAAQVFLTTGQRIGFSVNPNGAMRI